MITLREKICQLFITGYTGDNPENSPILSKLLKENLGGIIFFTQNITDRENFKKDVKYISEIAKSPLFLSIDQEGGRVERTENLYNGQKKYLSAKFAAQKGLKFLEKQTIAIADELKSFGLNMNFSPVADTNTNPKNPIIAERAYSDNPDDVYKYASLVAETYKNNGIIPVVKHFPGHGDTSKDSHLELPVVNMDKFAFEKNHLKPFAELVKSRIDAIMAAHVYYEFYEKNNVPATMSKIILKDILRKKLGFKGLVISDDMFMGGIKNFPNAYITGLKAGLNMFIYRFCDDDLIKIIDDIEQKAQNDSELLNSINVSYNLILQIKKEYKIIL